MVPLLSYWLCSSDYFIFCMYLVFINIFRDFILYIVYVVNKDSLFLDEDQRISCILAFGKFYLNTNGCEFVLMKERLLQIRLCWFLGFTLVVDRIFFSFFVNLIFYFANSRKRQTTQISTAETCISNWYISVSWKSNSITGLHSCCWWRKCSWTYHWSKKI